MIDYRRRQTIPHSEKTLTYHCRDPIKQLILLKFIPNPDVLTLQYSWIAPAASVAALLGYAVRQYFKQKYLIVSLKTHNK